MNIYLSVNYFCHSYDTLMVSFSPFDYFSFLIRHQSVFLISLYVRLIRNDTTTPRIVLLLFLRLITHISNSKNAANLREYV